MVKGEKSKRERIRRSLFYNFQLGELAVREGCAAAYHNSGQLVSRDTVRYWKDRFVFFSLTTKQVSKQSIRNSVLRSSPRGPWGGYRWSRYTKAQEKELKAVLYNHVVSNRGLVSVKSIQEALNALTITKNMPAVRRWWILRVLRQWGWTWKCGEIVQWRKYSAENNLYYQEYISWTLHQDPEKLVFIDECSFDSRALQHRRVLAPKG